jgi:hypothetical protein
VAAPVAPAVTQRRRRRPPRTAAQVRPLASPSAPAAAGETRGSANQSFAAIARYCLARTAIQNTGSDTSRNAVSVAVRSNPVPRRSAASTPVATPSTMARTVAAVTSRSVDAAACPTSVLTS